MTHMLDDVISMIARQVVVREEWLDCIRTLGINPADWPKCQARSILEKYIELRDRHNHQYAFHMLANEVSELPLCEGVPLEPMALKASYGEALAALRAKELARALMFAKPNEVDAILERYISQRTSSVRIFNIADEIQSVIENNEKLVAKGESIVEIAGWEFFCRMIGGLNPGRVGILTADTGFGKTNLALNFAISACQLKPVLFVNMEMIAQDLAEKIIMSGSRTEFGAFKKAQYNWDGLEEFISKIKGKRLIYTDGKSLSVPEIFALARREKATHGLGMIFVDYDQKISVTTSRETPEWKALQIVVEQLEALAKELEVYVMLMAQSNDDGDPSGSKRSKNPASTVLRFYEHEGVPVIRAIKNRFGKAHAALEVEYKPERAFVKEKGYIDVTQAKQGRLK